MSRGSENGDTLERFIASAPQPQRMGMRVLAALRRRPRGRSMLEHAPALNQLAQMIASLGHYDDPGVAEALGWDGAAVVARGKALRRAEGRP